MTQITNGLAYRVQKQLSKHKRINTQADLAQYLGLHQTSISRMLNNPKRKINQAIFDKLVNFLQCEPYELEIILENDALSQKELQAKHASLEAIAREQSVQIRELGQRIDDATAMIEAMERRQRWEAEADNGI